MWPDDRDLPVEVEAAFGADLTADPGTWSFTDLSSRLRAEPIRIRAGRSSGASVVSPSTCSVVLDNPDGALTPAHPMSPYWPDVTLGTPLRVRLRRAEDEFGRSTSSTWSTSDSGQVWSHAGGSPSNFSVSGGAGRHAHTTVNVLRRTILNTTLLDCEQVIDVAPSAMLTGAALVTGALSRMSGDQQTYYWLRAEFNSGGSTLQLKISKTVAGVETQLGSLTPVPSVAYAANTPLRVVASVVGSRLAIKVWNPAGTEAVGWQLSVTDTSITTAGSPGLQSWLVGGNTNTLPVSAIFYAYSLRVDRSSGFADQWEPKFVPTTTPGQADSYVSVTASGILRRLGQGTSLDESPLRRTIRGSKPAAYYPAEDGTLATAAGSAVAGQSPLVVSGPVEFRSFNDYDLNTSTIRYGTSALGDLAAGGRLSVAFGGNVVAATNTAWTVHVIGQFDIAYASGDIVLMEWTTPGGTFTRWQLVESPSTVHTQVIAYNAAGAPTVVVDRVGTLGGIRTWVVSAQQVGGNINVSYRLDATESLTGTVAGTLGGVASMTINPTGTTSTQPMPFGHLAVWGTPEVPYRTDGVLDEYGRFVQAALRSYQGEPAHVRLARLAAEDGVALDMPEVSGDVDLARMGPQQAGTPVDLYRECADADMGVLYELGYGLGYIPREHRYNPPVAMTVDLAQYRVTGGGSADVLRPILDDQGIRNQLTVSRRDGSSVVVADQESQQRNGVYDDSVEVNLASDEQLTDQAAWRLHLARQRAS